MGSKNHFDLSSKNKKLRKNNVKFKKFFIKKYLNKKNMLYFVLLLSNIILIIYTARRNVVNYVTISEKNIFVSKTRYLLMGRNYITLIIITFFYGYTCLIKRCFLHEKLTKRFLVWLFVILVILNFGLFFIFTKRIY